MEKTEKQTIGVQTTVNAPVAKVWKTWSNPADIMQWCQASDDWHAPYADNDLRVNGKFRTTMAARDGSAAFDFEGVYTGVEENKRIAYAMSDGRKVEITFEDNGNKTTITESFDPEDENDIEMQRGGWQAILDNFKTYTEKSA